MAANNPPHDPVDNTALSCKQAGRSLLDTPEGAALGFGDTTAGGGGGGASPAASSSEGGGASSSSDDDSDDDVAGAARLHQVDRDVVWRWGIMALQDVEPGLQ